MIMLCQELGNETVQMTILYSKTKRQGTYLSSSSWSVKQIVPLDISQQIRMIKRRCWRDTGKVRDIITFRSGINTLLFVWTSNFEAEAER